MKLRHYIYICGVLAALWSCSGNGSTRSVVDAEPVTIERFDSLVAGYTQMDAAGRATFRERYSPAICFVLSGNTDTTQTDSLLTEYVGSRVMTVFGRDVRERFRLTDSVGNQLGMARAVLCELFPQVKWPERVIGVISPYSQSVVFTDSCALVGLNHFLGSDYAGYGYFEPYQRRLKEPGQLPVRLVESVVATGCPYEGTDESTALSRMLYDGAVLWGVRESLPGTPDSVLMGWSAQQTEWVEANLPRIWQSMIERNLLFTTDMSVADRLTRMAPSTSLIHSEAPGRLGSYIGMLIVERFLNANEQAEPKQMLDPAVYNSSTTLVKSGFAPQLSIGG